MRLSLGDRMTDRSLVPICSSFFRRMWLYQRWPVGHGIDEDIWKAARVDGIPPGRPIFL
jgi:hypothetical protein